MRSHHSLNRCPDCRCSGSIVSLSYALPLPARLYALPAPFRQRLIPPPVA